MGLEHSENGWARYRTAYVDQQIREKISMGRLGKASDIASLAAFLASGLSGYITGETIVVDGGYLAG